MPGVQVLALVDDHVVVRGDLLAELRVGEDLLRAGRQQVVARPPLRLRRALERLDDVPHRGPLHPVEPDTAPCPLHPQVLRAGALGHPQHDACGTPPPGSPG